MLKDLYDCSTLLNHLPHLQQFKVGAFQIGGSLDSENINQHNSNNNNNSIAPHFHLRRLELCLYQPSTDDELAYIMKKFSDLNHLTVKNPINSRNNVSWPVSAISSTVMLSFMEFFQKT